MTERPAPVRAVDDPITAVGDRLREEGRAFVVRGGVLVVLDTGVAQRVDDVARDYALARSRGDDPVTASRRVVGLLDEHGRRATAVGDPSRVRLRVADGAEVDDACVLPGPAGLTVYPVLDEADAAIRLSPSAVSALGGLEAVALAPTLAEPVRVRDAPVGSSHGWHAAGDLYTASRVLDIADLLRELGLRQGDAYVIGVPTCREVWVFTDNGDPQLHVWVRAAVDQAYGVGRGRVSSRPLRWDGRDLGALDDQPGSSDIGP